MFEPNSKKKVGDEIIRPYELRDIRSPGPLVYQTPTLQNSLRSAQEIPQRDRKFSIDPLLKDILTNDDETEKQIRNQVEERIHALREETLENARKEGHSQGFEEGKNIALEEYREVGRSKLEIIEQMVVSFEAAKDEIFQAQERFLIDLVFRVSGVILRRELKTDREYIQRLLKGIVEEMGVRELLKIWVHPAQLEEAKKLRPEFEKSFSSLKNLTIESHSNLEDLDCVVETDWNRMDASFDTQISRLHSKMIERIEQDAGKSPGSNE
jgi:flagellar assembly protein FliH